MAIGQRLDVHILGGNAVNKAQLIEALSTRFDGNKRAAAQALESVLDTITRQVAAGEKVGITGFGTFEKINRPARMVRNPRTGERKRAKKTAVAKFRPGAELKAVVAGEKKLPRLAPAKTTAAKSTASKTSASKSTSAAAKKSTGRSAAKSTPAKSTASTSTARKSTSTSTAKKASTRSTAAKSTSAKKSPARSTAKKTTTARAAASKKTTTAKKSPAKRTTRKR